MAQPRAPRNTLSRERVVAAALELADAEGLDALTIRSLATRLGVRPMAIYHHVESKDGILDALVDEVFAGVLRPDPAADWREQLAQRSRSLRAALHRHRWALTVIETRTQPGPASLANHESVLEVLRSAGFTLAATAHAYAVLDAFVYGFALQEAMLASVDLEGSVDELIAGIDFSAAPRMAELAREHVAGPGYRFGDSFEVGLAMVLDGLATLPREPAG